ncbi:fimbrial protein [Pantoea sp. 1.19]|uniref:fimbrial protein n=1 Tax=Pantoea sp. 1.19 TaxID=1925589 RepID=UPI00147A4BA6|nr:fimbrial protein [Pantoea sp. 1.19]
MKRSVCGLLLCAALVASAAADTLMQFKGNLVVPVCTVNNNAQVTVDFGDIEIQTLVTSNTPYAMQSSVIPIVCPYVSGKPMLTVTASSVYNAAQGILQTSKFSEGLVVFLRQKDSTKILPIGTPTLVTDSVTLNGNVGTLTLNAGVGTVGDSSKLTAGPFTASATLQVQYQ